MELNINDNDNKLQDSNNREYKVNIMENTQDIENQENQENQEIRSQKSKVSKEKEEINKIINDGKILKNYPRKTKQNQRKIFTKHVKAKKQKMKINTNPFLTENITLDYNNQKNKNSKTSYLNNYKTNINDISDSTINKTVFSKISENMYKNNKDAIFPTKKARNLELEGEENYNKLTEEAFLCSCANKTNKENKTIIYEFLGRKKNEEISKKIGLDSDKENEVEILKDLKRLTVLTDRNRSYTSSRTFQEFLKDQKNKEEKHISHLETNINLHKKEVDSYLKDRPTLNDETLKIAKSKINMNTNIYYRLYQNYDDKKKTEEEKGKEKMILEKNDKKKLSKVKIKENIERLYHEYEVKKKRIDENELRKINEIRNLSSNHSNTNKISNAINFKRFKKNLENSIENIICKKWDENFEINFYDFVKLLYTINFTTKNYFELIENNENNKVQEKIKINITSKINKTNTNRVIYKKTNYEFDKEYKLMTDAWKIIIKSKEFKKDLLGSSKRLLLFLLSVLGIFKENIDDAHFIKKEFSFMLKFIKDSEGGSINYTNLSKQIYKYFSLYRNNAINGLLFRDKKSKRRLELENEIEQKLPFYPNLSKTSKDLFSNNHSNSRIHLSVEKYYDQYRKNKELKLKEKEKILEKEEREKFPLAHCSSKVKEKKNIIEISKRLHNARLKHLKNSSSTPNDLLVEEKFKKDNGEKTFNSNYNSIQRMFNNNPLEKDYRVQKKIKELKESRNQKSFNRLILKKGFKPKEYCNLYELNDENGRFAHDDEPLNNFKNTFQKYERVDKNLGNREKYVFEIIVDNKPKNLIIYLDEDINYKVKVFCNVYKLTYNDKKRILQTIYQQLKGRKKLYC